MRPLISYYVYTIVMYVLGFSLTTVLALLGVFSNAANIIVFCKLGFQESTNISLHPRAINDLMASTANVVVEISQSPFLKIEYLPQGSLILQTTYLASFVVYSCLWIRRFDHCGPGDGRMSLYSISLKSKYT